MKFCISGFSWKVSSPVAMEPCGQPPTGGFQTASTLPTPPPRGAQHGSKYRQTEKSQGYFCWRQAAPGLGGVYGRDPGPGLTP